MKLFSSAYNTWPADNEGRLAFVTELAERDWVGGLELGYADSPSPGLPARRPICPPSSAAFPEPLVTTPRTPISALLPPMKPDVSVPSNGPAEKLLAVARLVAEGHPIKAVQLHRRRPARRMRPSSPTR